MDIVTRAKNILLAPASEWPVIAGEATSASSLFTGYVFPLVAIGQIAGIIGGMLSGGAFGLVTMILFAIVGFVLAVVGVYVLGFIAAKIAPSFGGKDDLSQALKLVAYSYTAAWVAGVFNILPAIGVYVVLIASLYGLYLLYTGVSPMMSVPREKSVGYTVVVILVAIGVYVVFTIFVSSVIIGMIAVASK
jgi:Yip1 domain